MSVEQTILTPYIPIASLENPLRGLATRVTSYIRSYKDALKEGTTYWSETVTDEKPWAFGDFGVVVAFEGGKLHHAYVLDQDQSHAIFLNRNLPQPLRQLLNRLLLPPGSNLKPVDNLKLPNNSFFPTTHLGRQNLGRSTRLALSLISAIHKE